MLTIGIFVGTVYGNAHFIAEEIQPVLEKAGHQIVLYDEPTLAQWQQPTLDIHLIITSTTGQGDFPDNIVDLYLDMQQQSGYQPSIRYGVIALGDSSYADFCQAGRNFDQLLQSHQAVRIGEVLYIDATETTEPEQVVLEWLPDWLVLL